ncbi:MAG: hypothetical protein ISS81_02910 [Candidatus Marinimicrobia bacterium]|nr:hypothetical protein [Candidatus Neomarinimicrobiota bacterium]
MSKLREKGSYLDQGLVFIEYLYVKPYTTKKDDDRKNNNSKIMDVALSGKEL